MSLSKIQKKIVVRIVGGIGNQLFCYAAARRLAIVNDAELIIDNISGFARDFEYQRQYQLDHFHVLCRKATDRDLLEPFARVRRYLKRGFNNRRPFVARNYIRQEGVDFDARLLNVKPRGTVYLEGYWQSEDYFKDVADTLRQDLQIKPPADITNHAIAEQMRGCAAVAVHVRFFDQPKATDINNGLGGYYAGAVETMERLDPAAHYFIFSDQPEPARARVPLPDSRVTLVTHNHGDKHAYADLWLMTQCKHFIIANSTFSWWGAWLAGHSAKQVIAPGFEARQSAMRWGFKGLLPSEWIKL